MTTDDRVDALRSWARGLLPTEAAVELIISAVGGRLLDGPWVRRDDLGHVYLDPEVAVAEAGALSGGERRVLAIATSLISNDHPVSLGDAITGLDPDAFGSVLTALTHAGGHRKVDGAVEVLDQVSGTPPSAAASDEGGTPSAPAPDSTHGHEKRGGHGTD